MFCLQINAIRRTFGYRKLFSRSQKRSLVSKFYCTRFCLNSFLNTRVSYLYQHIFVNFANRQNTLTFSVVRILTKRFENMIASKASQILRNNNKETPNLFTALNNEYCTLTKNGQSLLPQYMYFFWSFAPNHLHFVKLVDLPNVLTYSYISKCNHGNLCLSVAVDGQ